MKLSINKSSNAAQNILKVNMPHTNNFKYKKYSLKDLKINR